MKPLYMFLFFSILLCGTANGQIKIGDNPQNIDPSSVLELESNSRVLVITRINTEDMNFIDPSQGALIYNTDEECIFYYDGNQWINLCSSLGITFTSDGIVNPNTGVSTIVITQTGDNYNFEVAPNSIRSAQITDGGINGDDIQNNSLGIDKIGIDAVGSEELAANAVGSEEIIDQSIQPIDIMPGSAVGVLTTDAGSNVQWSTLDASIITGQDLTADDGSITVTNGNGATIVDAGISVTNGGITTAKLDLDAVDNTRLADDAVQVENILNGTAGQVLRTNAAGTDVEWAAPFHSLGKMNQDAITKGHNIATVNDLGIGIYQVDFTADADSADYIIQLTLLNAGADVSIEVTAQTVGDFTVQITDSLGASVDADWYFTVIDF